MTQRRFTEQQVSLILRKALEEGLEGSREAGLSLSELKDIAREVGIDPSAVEAAARDVDTAEPGSHRLLGAAVSIQREALVDGTVTEADYPELVLAIRRVMGRHGLVDHELGSLVWRARDEMGGRYITVRPSGNGTLVRALGNFRDGALLFFLTVPWAGIIPAVILMKKAGTLGLIAGPIVMLGGLLSARWIWRRRQKREDEMLQTAIRELIRVIESRHGSALPSGEPEP